jgi:hypothetical protein
VGGFQEVEIIGLVDPQQRLLTLVGGLLGHSDRIEDRAGAARMLGMGNPRAIVQLLRGRVGELAGVEEAAHRERLAWKARKCERARRAREGPWRGRRSVQACLSSR